MHGTWDTLVPFEQSTWLHQRLRSEGVANLRVPIATFEHMFEAGYHGGSARMHRFAFERLIAATRPSG